LNPSGEGNNYSSQQLEPHPIDDLLFTLQVTHYIGWSVVTNWYHPSNDYHPWPYVATLLSNPPKNEGEVLDP
jgi:hypothetical protein